MSNTVKKQYQYLNIGLIHNPQDGNNASVAATDIIRSTPVLADTTGYEVVVQRITVPIASIPSFVAPLKVGSQFEDNQMIYSFTTAFNGQSSPQEFVTWIPQTTFYPQPTGVVQYSLQSDKFFYHAYNITTVFAMFNATIQASLTALNALTQLPIGYENIELYFDQTLGKPILYVPASCVDIELYFNNQMAAVFSSWRYTTVNKNDPDGKDNLFTFYSTRANTDQNENLTIQPENFNYSYLSPIQTVQIRSTLPIVYENTQQVNVNYGETALINNPYQSFPASQNILTDFTIDSGMLSSEGSYFVYNKTDSTRYISFNGGKTVQNFNLSVYWTDNSNASYPMFLLPLTAINIKLIFIPGP